MLDAFVPKASLTSAGYSEPAIHHDKLHFIGPNTTFESTTVMAHVSIFDPIEISW